MQRTGFIGGSDTVKIIQGKWHQLWLEKTGRSEPEDLSNVLPVQLGIHTESFNLAWFAKQYGATIGKSQETFERTIGSVPVRGTIDGWFNGCVVEAKHTNAFNTMDDVVELYMPQLQTYIRASDADGAFLSVIFGNQKWEAIHVARDDKYFDSMWGVVSDFWGYVVRDEQPDDPDATILSTDAIALDHMVRRDASRDNHFVAAAEDYIKNQAAAKAFEVAKNDLKNMVAPNEREVYSDRLVIKRSKNRALRITVKDSK